ncbi:MAG: hypothetical protein JSV88_06975 [Candidatus Aminicenantes bacterium]|nr:MAG: hypothetical protein JSV88_06975 [Candidatus Aminicenantes bacterium]
MKITFFQLFYRYLMAPVSGPIPGQFVPLTQIITLQVNRDQHAVVGVIRIKMFGQLKRQVQKKKLLIYLAF